MSRFNVLRSIASAGAVTGVLGMALIVASPALAAEFGLHKFVVSARNQDGTADVQAGSHPYSLNTTFVLNTEVGQPSGGELKDVRLELPPGLVGDPNATPKCSYQEFAKMLKGHSGCTNETAIGTSTTTLDGYEEDEPIKALDPVYNLVPPAGVAAEFGFVIAQKVPVLLETSVRTGSDYGLTTTVPNVNQAAIVLASKVTIWGVPAAPAHNLIRGTCLHLNDAGYYNSPDRSEFEGPDSGLGEGEDELEGPIGPFESFFPLEPTGACEASGGVASAAPELPLLTNPTSCGTPRTATLSVDDWQEPGDFEGSRTMTASLPPLSGCEKLNFSPTLDVTPDGTDGSTPTGLNIALHVPQEPAENPAGLAEADVRDTTVTLPQGVQLSPAAADGLQGCSLSQIGFTGYAELDPSVEPGVQTAQFTPEKPSCPNASKLANVKIKTPLLEGELEGAVYLAAPQNFAGLAENPFSSLFALYLVAEEPKAGVLIKLPGKVIPNETTGQITTTFENTPQLPFSELKLEFFGTERAPLAMPALCGSYKTEASLTPWSGGAAKDISAEFQVTSGPNGAPCSDPLPFTPSLSSGTTNVNAGSFSELVTTLSREDGQQSIQSVVLHYPPGLSALLSGVKLCPEAQANAGTCGPESLIGESIVSVGLGNEPFTVTGGKVYITEGYDGAPYGLSIVNPAKAGPFDLQEGRPVIVRARIEVNPITAALTVTTNSGSEPDHIPTIIDGVPLQIKHVQVNINRPGFTFNPTSCEKMSVTGTIDSAEGASSPVSVPFQVANCGALKFQPAFSASTSAKTSRKDGASLKVHVAYPQGALGSDANLAYAKVELPKALPSELKTLKLACVAKVFAANPAACPAESIVGHAVVHTPVLPVPLEGPAYFVSEGTEWPELIMVLQGYGVTIELVGETLIKKGVTSSTFKSTPDVPFESFELTLPEQEYSALAANGDLCDQKLLMPTFLHGQNGATLEQSTRIEVEGCPNKLSVVGRKLRSRTLTLKVAVPSAGKLSVNGDGVSAAKGTSSGRGPLTLTLHVKKAAAKKHGKGKHAKKPKTTIKLTFKPKSGKKLTKKVKVRI